MNPNPVAFKEVGPGRPKGSKNKFTQLKDNFYQVFEDIGGIDRMKEWVLADARNLTTFYTLLSKLLPTRVEGMDNNNTNIFVADKGNGSISTEQRKRIADILAGVPNRPDSK